MAEEIYKGGNAQLRRKMNADAARIRQLEADNRRLASRPLNDGRILERVPTRKVGTCKIDATGVGGNYIITELTWNGSSYDAATAGIFQVLARDFLNRAYGREGSTPIHFWQQNQTDGTPEYVIDSMPIPDIPNTSNDHILHFNASEDAGAKLEWIETTSECPEP